MSTIMAGAKGQRNIERLFKRLAGLESASGLAEVREQEVITRCRSVFVEDDAWVIAGMVGSVPDPLITGKLERSVSSLAIAGIVGAIRKMGYVVEGFGVSPSGRVWALKVPFGENATEFEVAHIRSKLDLELDGIYHQFT